MTDKPRIRLHVWYDCGWRYAKWVCKLRGTINGYGDTPEMAYDDWQMQMKMRYGIR